MIFQVLCTVFGVGAAFSVLYLAVAICKNYYRPPTVNGMTPRCVFYGAAAGLSFFAADVILLLTRIGLER